MSWIDGPLLGFDLETTGPDPSADLPVSYALVFMDKGQVKWRKTGIINPGVPIPEMSTLIHGITNEQAAAQGVSLDQATDLLIDELISASHQGIPLVGMNLCFDLTVVDHLCKEAYLTGLEQMGWAGPVIDLLILDRRVDKQRRGHRRLSDLAAYYGIAQIDAHEAEADVMTTLACLKELCRRYEEITQFKIDHLYLAQMKWYREWAIGFNEYKAQQGQPFVPAILCWPLEQSETVHSQAS